MNRCHGGYSLIEALVGVALLGGAALGVAAALGQAERFSAVAARRDREAAIRADAAALPDALLAAGVWELVAGSTGSPAAAAASSAERCWRRAVAVGAGLVWIEARCGVRRVDLPMARRAPGLLVTR
jgi:Tfp pilus assembly protein PilV